MKKPGLLFSTFRFLLSTFYFLFSITACVLHPVSEADPIIEASAPDNSFEKEVKEALDELSDSYYLGDATVPVLTIWDNINFKSFDHLTFFNSACPAANRIEDNDELKCDLSSGQKLRQFSIKKDGDKIKIKFDKFGRPGYFLTAKWTIEKKTGGLKITRYEQIWNGGYYTYKIANSEYKLEGKNQQIAANGAIGHQNFGSFSFGTDSLCFCTCQNVPDGRIRVMAGDDRAEIFFSNDCSKTSAYVKINEYDGKYKYNNEDGWVLRDLSEYLKYFLK